MPVTPSEHDITVNGLKLHYREWGDPGAPPLLLVHGLTRESHTFDRLCGHLASRVRCIAMDVRGRGESDWGKPEDYSIAQYARDVRGLLAALKLETVHYLGTSMGGMIGMELAADTPEMFRSLAMNDMGPEIPSESSQGVQKHVERCGEGFDSLTDLIDFETLRYPWYAQTPRAMLEESYKYLVRHRDGRVYFHFDPNIVLGRAANVGQARAEQVARNWASWKGLRCPLLLVRGAESNILLPETVVQMRKAQPKMVFVEIPGVGHAPTLLEPPVVKALEAMYA